MTRELIIEYLPVILSAIMTFFIIPYITGKIKNLTIKSELKEAQALVKKTNIKAEEIAKENRQVNEKLINEVKLLRARNDAMDTKYQSVLLENAELRSKLNEISEFINSKKETDAEIIRENLEIMTILRGVYDNKLHKESQD